MSHPTPRHGLLAFLLCAVSIPCPAPAGSGVTTPESVREEYPRALAALEARYSHCRGEGIFSSFRTPAKGGRNGSQSRVKAGFAFDGGNGLLVTTPIRDDERPGATPPGAKVGGNPEYQRVKVYNEAYSFLLTKQSPGSDYLIQSLDEGSGYGHRMIFNGPGHFVRGASMAHYIPIAHIFATKGFRIDRVADVPSSGPRRSRVEFSIPLKPQTKSSWVQFTSGWFVVSPEEQWILHEYGLTTTYSHVPPATEVGHVQYERGPSGRLQPVKADYRAYRTEFRSDPSSDPAVIPAVGEDFQFTKLEFTDTPRRDFTLSAFGLPEYGQTAPRRPGPPFALWIFGAALVALVAAVVLRRLSTRPGSPGVASAA